MGGSNKSAIIIVTVIMLLVLCGASVLGYILYKRRKTSTDGGGADGGGTDTPSTETRGYIDADLTDTSLHTYLNICQYNCFQGQGFIRAGGVISRRKCSTLHFSNTIKTFNSKASKLLNYITLYKVYEKTWGVSYGVYAKSSQAFIDIPRQFICTSLPSAPEGYTYKDVSFYAISYNTFNNSRLLQSAYNNNMLKAIVCNSDNCNGNNIMSNAYGITPSGDTWKDVEFTSPSSSELTSTYQSSEIYTKCTSESPSTEYNQTCIFFVPV